MLLIGCCGNTETYELISAMGYDYIELSARQIMTLSEKQFSNFLERCQKVPFPCRGFNDFCSAEYPLAGPHSNLETLTEYTEHLCLRGARLGIKTIGIGAPAARVLPDDYPIEQANVEMERFLRMASAVSSKYHITILLEAVHQYLCNYMTYTKDALAMVQRLDLPNMAMVLDYYHAMVMNEDVHQLSYAMPYVRHLHISTDLLNHERGFLKKEELPFLTNLLREALECGYSGAISVEASLDRLKEDGGGCADIMRTAVQRASEQMRNQ